MGGWLDEINHCRKSATSNNLILLLEDIDKFTCIHGHFITDINVSYLDIRSFVLWPSLHLYHCQQIFVLVPRYLAACSWLYQIKYTNKYMLFELPRARCSILEVMEGMGRLVQGILVLARIGHQFHHKPMDGIVRPSLLERIDKELAQILEMRVDGNVGRNLGLLTPLYGRKRPRGSQIMSTDAPIADGIFLLLVRKRNEAGLHGRTATAILGLGGGHGSLHEELTGLHTGDGELILLPHNGSLHIMLVLILMVCRFMELLLLL